MRRGRRDWKIGLGASEGVSKSSLIHEEHSQSLAGHCYTSSSCELCVFVFQYEKA